MKKMLTGVSMMANMPGDDRKVRMVLRSWRAKRDVEDRVLKKLL